MCEMFYGVFFLVMVVVVRPTLTEPEKQQGPCVPLHACAEALYAFTNPPKGSESYLRQFLCGGEQGINIYCDNSTDFSMLAEQHSYSIDAFAAVFEKHAQPGCDRGSDRTPMLPVVLAKNLDSNLEYIKCVGVQINEKYVITPAQCLAQDNKTQDSSIVRIRFTTPSKSYFYDIEEKITHQFYDPTTGMNDLALLRLNDTASSDGNAFPCLRDITSMDSPDVLLISGGLNGPTTEQWRKETISAQYFPNEICGEMLKNKNVNIVVTSYTICAKKLNFTNGSCDQYAGVPLHFTDYDHIYLTGISSSRIDCAGDIPEVFTNLYKYKRWLIDNMRPWGYGKCTTPNGETGRCKSIIYCPAILELFSDARNGTTEFLREFICREDDLDLVVCCPVSSDGTVFDHSNALLTNDVPPQFIESELCGLQHSDDYFSSSTVVPKIDEFPWLAAIDSARTVCAGILLNKRYVISTAYCLWTPSSGLVVRLGDYNYYTDQDCIKDLDVDGTDCTETKYFGVEAVIIHPFYNAPLTINNVGLIRLNETVSYTDYIRPICLPLQGTEMAKPGDVMNMSGWCFDSDARTVLKGKRIVKVIPKNECGRRFRRALTPAFIGDRSICANKLINDVLDDDYCGEGGALISHHRYTWHIEGISLRRFATYHHVPFHYLNISKYMNWILENMYSW